MHVPTLNISLIRNAVPDLAVPVLDGVSLFQSVTFISLQFNFQSSFQFSSFLVCMHDLTLDRAHEREESPRFRWGSFSKARRHMLTCCQSSLVGHSILGSFSCMLGALY